MSEEKMIHNVSVLDFGRFYREAEIMIQGLEISFRLHLDTLEDLDDDTFWNMLAELKKQINRTIPSKIKATSVNDARIKLACSRLSHGYFFKENEKVETLLRFVKTYSRKANKLYTPLFKVIEGFGDDGFDDILDSFPLFGRKRYEAALEGKIEGDSDNQDQGENYIAMSLESEAFKLFCSHTRSEADQAEDGDKDRDDRSYYVAQRRIYDQLGLKG